MTRPLSLQVQPKDIVAFLPVGLRTDYLEHNTYRWIRKAKVSLLSRNDRRLRSVVTGDKLRIISDGLCNKVEHLD